MIVLISRWMGPAVRSQCTAEDIWQEALAAAWRDREKHEWRGVREYRAWLLEIAKNRVRDFARRQQAQRRGGGEGAALFSELQGGRSFSLSALLPHGSTTPSRVAHHNEQARLMEQALASLPGELEPLVRMHLFEERTMEDIAAELGIGLSAAWYRFRKGSERYAASLAHLKSIRPSDAADERSEK